MSIHRYTKRDKRSVSHWCAECESEQKAGYWLYWSAFSGIAMFVCDKCLKAAKTKGTFTAARQGEPTTPAPSRV